mmetsp:Transcript_27592/g.87683  ORF Transcript_27592/g.87683 Transcript_27592/m.87683 type:complete len:418 (+) Transcript_27592:210-1463(+)
MAQAAAAEEEVHGHRVHDLRLCRCMAASNLERVVRQVQVHNFREQQPVTCLVGGEDLCAQVHDAHVAAPRVGDVQCHRREQRRQPREVYADAEVRRRDDLAGQALHHRLRAEGAQRRPHEVGARPGEPGRVAADVEERVDAVDVAHDGLLHAQERAVLRAPHLHLDAREVRGAVLAYGGAAGVDVTDVDALEGHDRGDATLYVQADVRGVRHCEAGPQVQPAGPPVQHVHGGDGHAREAVEARGDAHHEAPRGHLHLELAHDGAGRHDGGAVEPHGGRVADEARGGAAEALSVQHLDLGVREGHGQAAAPRPQRLRPPLRPRGRHLQDGHGPAGVVQHVGPGLHLQDLDGEAEGRLHRSVHGGAGGHEARCVRRQGQAGHLQVRDERRALEGRHGHGAHERGQGRADPGGGGAAAAR